MYLLLLPFSFRQSDYQSFRHVIAYCYLPYFTSPTKEKHETSRCRPFFGCRANGFVRDVRWTPIFLYWRPGFCWWPGTAIAYSTPYTGKDSCNSLDRKWGYESALRKQKQRPLVLTRRFKWKLYRADPSQTDKFTYLQTITRIQGGSVWSNQPFPGMPGMTVQVTMTKYVPRFCASVLRRGSPRTGYFARNENKLCIKTQLTYFTHHFHRDAT